VKVIFEDGKVRIFDNSVDSSTYWGKVGIVRIKKGD
jgi:predicted membrane GTPase involved in stress response